MYPGKLRSTSLPLRELYELESGGGINCQHLVKLKGEPRTAIALEIVPLNKTFGLVLRNNYHSFY